MKHNELIEAAHEAENLILKSGLPGKEIDAYLWKKYNIDPEQIWNLVNSWYN